MSLTNPNKTVTEQRLNEYHQTILPYLGGMPEILANKFARGDMYSTDEKMVGQWIDGKPIYQKILTGTTHETAGSWKAISLNASIDQILPGSAVRIVDDATGSWILNNFRDTDTKYVEIEWASNNYSSVNWKNAVGIKVGSGLTSKDIVILVRYTKTTDSAISIGLDTDYSTEEQIIGTWIDGKPLYQKTITGNTPTTATEATQVVYTFSSEVSIKEFYGLCGEGIPLNHYINNNYKIATMVSNTAHTIRQATYGFLNLPWVITIKYTKTTD